MSEWNAETAEWYAAKYGEYATNRLGVDALELEPDMTIDVESALNEGTTFTISFPAAFGEEAVPVSVDERQHADLFGDETVLLVEDDVTVKRLVSQVLERAGYSVLRAQNAGEGLLLMEQHGDEVDIVVSDVVMPMMSGYELVARLRQLRPDLPGLYISGYPEPPDGSGPEEGATLLLKPFDPATLLRAVRSALTEEEEE